jgi:hypothetical protein
MVAIRANLLAGLLSVFGSAALAQSSNFDIVTKYAGTAIGRQAQRECCTELGGFLLPPDRTLCQPVGGHMDQGDRDPDRTMACVAKKILAQAKSQQASVPRTSSSTQNSRTQIPERQVTDGHTKNHPRLILSDGE